MSYHDRRDSDPHAPGDLQPGYNELEMTRSWQTVPQEDEDATGYNPYTSQVSLQDSTSKQSKPSQDDEDAQMPLRQALKKYPKIAGYCFAMTIPVIGWGYDAVIVGAVASVDTFKADYGDKIKGEWDIPGNWLSLWMGLPPAGAAIGGLLGGWLQDRIGRKLTLLIGTIISIIAIACLFFSYLPESLDSKRMMLTAGLTVQAFTVGINKATLVTWVSENTPTALRGSAMALFPVFTLLGQLVGLVVLLFINQIKGSNGYLGAFASQWILALGPLLLSIFMPESPAHLIRKGQEARALRSATRLFSPKVSPYGQIERIRATIEEERALTGSATYWACLKGTNLRRTMIVTLGTLLPACFGMELLSSASIFLGTLGLKSNPAMMVMAGGVVAGMVGNGIGFYLLSRTGRRNMIIPSLAIAAGLWGAMGITGFWHSETLAWVAAGLMIAVIVICGLGAWPASYAILGETSSLQLRSLTQGLSAVVEKGVSIGLAVIMPLLYSRDKAALGAKTAFIFSALSIISALLSWLFIPEMKGRSAIEIDHMFEIGLSARKFKGYKMEAHHIQEVSPLATSGQV